jgi:hypothetical protein
MKPPGIGNGLRTRARLQQATMFPLPQPKKRADWLDRLYRGLRSLGARLMHVGR